MKGRGPGRSRLWRIGAAGGLALIVTGALLGCAPSRPLRVLPPESPSGSAAPAPSRANSTIAYPFSARTFWRATLDDAPIAPRSRPMVDYLVTSITDRYNGVAAFNAHQYNSPLYTVAPDTPRVDVRFDDCQGKGYLPDGLTGEGGQFTAVPMPAQAKPATGTDAELSIWSPSSDQLWEFWKAKKGDDGTWSACWGGRIDDVSTGDGRFPGYFGATATGLPNAGGVVRYDEIRQGRIDHAISIVIPNPAVASDFSWPAQRSDGVDANPDALPEGSRLRLDPTLDVDALGLTPAGLIIARAAQKYGFVVVDRAGSVSVLAEQVDAADGSDPWRQLLGGPDYSVLADFPWSRLQVIQKDYGKPAS